MVWAIGAVAGLVFVGLLWWFLRSDARDGGGGAFDDDMPTRIVADGFFVRGLPIGSRFRWRARVNGNWRGGEADAAGGETFVYTGGVPGDVSIQPGAAVLAPPSSGPPSSDSDDGPFAGIPSAY